PEDLRGAHGALQVGADDSHRAELGDPRRGGLGLTQPSGVELDVGLPLQPTGGVMVGLAVAPQDDGAGRHAEAPLSSADWYRSPGSSTTGQSFHSRSRA